MKRCLPALLMLAACGESPDDGAVRVSVIGGPPTLVDPNKKAPDPTQRVLLGAVAEGLVTYDETGQIAPALAQRWIVTSDGLSAIFRIRPESWPNGRAITSGDVVLRARAMIAAPSRNPLRDAFDSIEEINATTPDVIEFRLTTPRPPLLELLAQPEAGLVSRVLMSAGPYKVTGRVGDTVSLRPRRDGDRPTADYGVDLTGERAATAIMRFQNARADLVLGGTYRDWPLLQQARPANRTIRIDPAEGLFGLSFVRTEGFFAQAENRRALAMAIDRDAILSTFDARSWPGTLAVLPARYRSAADPARPPWAVFDLAGRIAEARRLVARWRDGSAAPLQVRVFLPDGPGSTLFFGRLAADWRTIGIEAVRAPEKAADVRLVDLVAPAGSALWYLNSLSCPSVDACSEETEQALDRARDAQSLVERGAQLAAADRALAESGLYVPIARPLRWSLVSPRLALFRENGRAHHPLHLLRRPPR